MSENKRAAESIELQEGIEAAPLRKRVRNLLILIGVHVDDNKRRAYEPASGGASLPSSYTTQIRINVKAKQVGGPISESRINRPEHAKNEPYRPPVLPDVAAA